MYGYIYKTTCLTTQKIYIGQHKSEKFNEKYLGSGVLLKRAVKEYNKDNFVVEMLDECLSQEELDQKEVYYINLYNSQNLDVGYNICIGGQKRFFTGQTHTEETRIKMSERAKKRPHPPTTTGRICYTNGNENKLLKSNQIEYYESLGWYKGKTIKNKVVAWNKGLTKETDQRVAKYTKSRNAHFERGESIGCYGIKGNTNGFVKGLTPWNKGAHKSTHELSLERKRNID